jgi:predicted dehydrogenase
MTAASTLRFAVVGCGSIGSRHAKNLLALGATELALCDLDRDRAARLADTLGAGVVSSDLASLLSNFRPDAVLVCTPPSTHLAVATAAVKADAHIFCEKPFAPALDGIEALLDLVERRQRFLMMAMCYRFHPGFRRLHQLIQTGAVGRLLGANMWAGQYLPDWHPWADYRTEYSAQRALGGGVLLDSIHSYDLVRWLFGEPAEVMGMVGKVSDLEIDTEDFATALVRLDGGAVVEVHVDYLQRHPRSRIEVIGAEGNLAWDATDQTIRCRIAGESQWSEESVKFAVNDMYLGEMAEFIDCVANGHPPTIDGAEGRATLALALAVRESAERGRMVRLGEPVRARQARRALSMGRRR